MYGISSSLRARFNASERNLRCSFLHAYYLSRTARAGRARHTRGRAAQGGLGGIFRDLLAFCDRRLAGVVCDAVYRLNCRGTHMDQVMAMDTSPEFMGTVRGKVGMWLFLLSDALTFGGLLCAYGALPIGSSDCPLPPHALPSPLPALNTFVLISPILTL